MKYCCLALAVVLLLLTATPAFTILCAMDQVPAATLLFPFIEVDLDDCGGGLKTLTTIINATPQSTIVHVTLWSDWSLPIIFFDMYLTGFDVETLDWGTLMCNGSGFPVNGPTVSNHGGLSGPPVDFPGCDFPLPSSLPPSLTGLIQTTLTGQPAPLGFTNAGQCLGSDRGNNIARAYLTVDVVNSCSFSFPSQLGYFEVIASFENRLLGEYAIGDSQSLVSSPAVHLEADSEGVLFSPGDHTFYGRYVGLSAIDRREPLPTQFGVRHLSTDPTNDTRLRVWREGVATNSAVPCGTTPIGIPLPQSTFLVFDEEENATMASVDIPTEVERISLAGLSPSSSSGWTFLDARHTGLQSILGDDLAQAWVTVEHPVAGLLQSHDGYPLDNTCTPLLIFADQFESGDTNAWSSTFP